MELAILRTGEGQVRVHGNEAAEQPATPIVAVALAASNALCTMSTEAVVGGEYVGIDGVFELVWELDEILYEAGGMRAWLGNETERCCGGVEDGRWLELGCVSTECSRSHGCSASWSGEQRNCDNQLWELFGCLRMEKELGPQREELRDYCVGVVMQLGYSQEEGQQGSSRITERDLTSQHGRWLPVESVRHDPINLILEQPQTNREE